MKIIAHRGDSASFPENTPEGWEAAYANGAFAIEADVRLSRDGFCVCAHDPDLMRLFGRPERPEDLPLQTMLDLKNDAGGRIAVLGQVLGYARGDQHVLLDIKDETPRALEAIWDAIVDIVPPEHRHLVIAGCHTLEAVQFFEARHETSILGFIPTPDDAKRFLDAGARLIRLWERDISPDRVAILHALGAEIWVTTGGRGTAFDVGDTTPERLAALAVAGVRGALVNDVAMTRSVQGSPAMSAGSTLIVTFDGLRRDRVRHEIMPNLSRFMAEGCDFRNSRSIFPSETRVAVTSTMTGSPPGAHGVVANQFIHPVRPEGLFRTSEWEDLELAAATGQLLDRQTMGERMAAAGKTMAVVSTATKGASRMMNSSAHALGQPVFTVHGVPVSTPDVHDAVVAQLGEIPAAGAPNSDRITYATSALMDVIYPQYKPDFCIFWMNEPDTSSHKFGVLGAETEAAMRMADDNFGRILAWWRAGNGPQNIIVMSDHGQITGHAQLSTLDIIPAGFGRASIGSFSGIYLTDVSDARKAEVVEWLVQQEFCGLVFASDGNGNAIPGALPWSAVRNDHPRGADVGFTLRATNSAEDFGPEADGCIFAAWITPGGGMHGGLNRGELSTVLAAQGPAYRRTYQSDVPCWLPDIIPTVLTTMGLSTDGAEGRPLVEALIGDDSRFGVAPEVETRVLSASLHGHEQYLRQWLIEGRTIVDCGWSAGRGAWLQ